MQQPALLVVAQSGRLIAQLAHQLGYPVWVADFFGDQDTLSVSERWQALPSLHDTQAITDTLVELSQGQACYLIYGSGVEVFYPALSLLPDYITIIGPSLTTLDTVSNPQSFFALLDHHQLPYPDTDFNTDQRQLTDRWLCKPRQGFGGQGIHDYGKHTLAEGYYLQRYLDGCHGAMLFLATDSGAQLLSVHRSFQTSSSDQPMLLSGLCGPLMLSDTLQMQLQSIADTLVAQAPLRGLNSVDFIVTSDDRLYILEVNARISASLALLDAPAKALEAHIMVCLGQPVPAFLPLKPIQPRQLHTLFAPRTFTVPDDITWPSYCYDIPTSGIQIAQQQPICSVVLNTDEPFAQSHSELSDQLHLLLGLT